MKPSTIAEAKAAGWVEMTPAEVDALRQSRPEAAIQPFGLGVDCNNAAEGTPCGGFGGPLASAIACFCRGGLCVCFRSATAGLP